MEDEKKVIEMSETELVEETTPKEGLVSKAKIGFKKYGKKIAVAAVVGTVGLIGYALGSKSKSGDDNGIDDVIDAEWTEVDKNENDGK